MLKFEKLDACMLVQAYRGKRDGVRQIIKNFHRRCNRIFNLWNRLLAILINAVDEYNVKTAMIK